MATRTTYKRLDILDPAPTATGADLLQDNFITIDDVIATIPAGGTTGQVLAKASNDDYAGEWIDAPTGGDGGAPGTPGAPGEAATITIGDVTTLPPGSSATVTNSGTTHAAVLDFGIPRGATGAAGTSGEGGGTTYTAGNGITIDDDMISVADNTFAPVSHSHAFSAITDKPTTLAGYGITDGVTAADLAGKLDAPINGPGMAGSVLTWDNAGGLASRDIDYDLSRCVTFSDVATVATSGLYSDLVGAPEPYTLPIASDTTLGGVKIGPGLTLFRDGILCIPDSNVLVSGLMTAADKIKLNALSTDKSFAAITNKPTTLAGYGITDTYTRDAVNALVSCVYRYSGTVASVTNLPTTDASVGDVYNVSDTGANYAWTGTSWDKLSETIDLSPYAKTTDLATIATTGAYSDLTGLPTIPEQYVLPIANDTTLGGIKIGTGLSVGTGGVVTTNIPTATATTGGLLSAADKAKLDGIEDGANNFYLRAADPTLGRLGGIFGGGNGCTVSNGNINMTVASATRLGGIAIGDGLVIAASGHLSTIPTPIATTDTAGLVKVGDNLTIDADGVLSATQTEVPLATTSTPGLIRVGTYLQVNSSGTVSVSLPNAGFGNNGLMTYTDKNKLDGIEAGANNYTLPEAGTFVCGGIRLGDNLSKMPDGRVMATDTTYDVATTTTNGLLSATDKVKIDNIVPPVITGVTTAAPSTTNPASAAQPVVVVETHLETTADSNVCSWWRKYSDGWIEQGGYIATAITTDRTATFDFATPFAQRMISINILVEETDKTGNLGPNVAYQSNTLTDFTLVNDSYVTNMAGFYWEAKGM